MFIIKHSESKREMVPLQTLNSARNSHGRGLHYKLST